MTTIARIQSLQVSLQSSTLIASLHTTIDANARIGIIGRNGSGKSTLLSIIANEKEAESGTIEWLSTPQLYYLKQEEEHFVWDSTTIEANKAIAKWQVSGGEYKQLSGGEQLRKRLAAALSERANVLLLDEPTNHLDQEGQAYLLAQINAFDGAVLIVSHDRAFLDQAATTIWAIDDGKVHVQRGNYSAYVKWHEHEKLTAERAYEKQQKKIARIEAQLAELTSWSSKAHRDSTEQEGFKEYYRTSAKRMDRQVKSKRGLLQRELEKERIDQPKKDQAIYLDISHDRKVGRRVLELKRFTKRFGERTLWQDAHFTIQHGEKIALIGENGSGKTTFIRIIMGDEEFEGELWKSPSLKVGYLSQTVFDLREDMTPEQLFDVEGYDRRGKLQTQMHLLGFRSEHWRKPIAWMSMGERVKLKLLLLMNSEMNVLICDEPTNHLDLPSREQLEKVLASYDGTLIVASHDRYFIEKVTNTSLRFQGHQLIKKSTEQETVIKDVDESKLMLETELQAVLGELSYLKPGDLRYQELDRKFHELTYKLKQL
jgi:macrolide transport system ATP-binding/permease protein